MDDEAQEIKQNMECKICGEVFSVKIWTDSPNEGLFWIGKAIWHHEDKHTEEEKAAVILCNDKNSMDAWERYIFTEEDGTDWEWEPPW
jgi:hypothetical protein